MFLQLLVGGIAVGCIYALIGLGYSLIYSASGLMSFVQGEIFMPRSACPSSSRISL